MSSLNSHLSGSGSKNNEDGGKAQKCLICQNCHEVFLNKVLYNLHTIIDCARNRQKKKQNSTVKELLEEGRVDEDKRDRKNQKTVDIEKTETRGSSEGLLTRRKPPCTLSNKSKSKPKPNKIRFNTRSKCKNDQNKSFNGGESEEFVDSYSDEYTEIDTETLFDNNGNARQNELITAAVNEELSKMIAFKGTTTPDTEFCIASEVNEDVQNNNETPVQSGIDNGIPRKSYTNENIEKNGQVSTFEDVQHDQSNVSDLSGFMDCGVRIIRRKVIGAAIGITKNCCTKKVDLEKDIERDNLKMVYGNDATRDHSIKNVVIPQIKECDVRINRISATDFRKMKNCCVMIKGLDKKFVAVLEYMNQESMWRFSVQQSSASGRENKVVVLSQDNAGQEMCDIQENTKDNVREEMCDIQENTKDNGSEEMCDIQENIKDNGSEEMCDIQENAKDNGSEEMCDIQENTKDNRIEEMCDIQENAKDNRSEEMCDIQENTKNNGSEEMCDIQENTTSSCDSNLFTTQLHKTSSTDIGKCLKSTDEEWHTLNCDLYTSVDREIHENRQNCSFSTGTFYSARSVASSSSTNDTYDSAMDETQIQSHFFGSDEEDIEEQIELIPKIKIKRKLIEGILEFTSKSISTRKRKASDLMEFQKDIIIDESKYVPVGNSDSMSNTVDSDIGTSSSVKDQVNATGDIHSDKIIPQILTKRKSKQWRPYSKEEDDKILGYMREKQMTGRQRGRRSWQVMEKENVCPGRSWQSMKERWIKHIELKLKNVANENGIN